MSLILTSQQNQVNSRPFDYMNYFSQTMKIPKNSKIALNHCTINRNAFFNFEENKVLSFYHGVEMPSVKIFEMSLMPEVTSGKPDPLLTGSTAQLTSRELNNFCNYPQFVVIQSGEYSINQLVENLQQNLNNPDAVNGGDFLRTGYWTVKANYDSQNVFINITFDWETKTNTITASLPPNNSFLKKYTNNDTITYSSPTITGGDADWNCGEIDRFINNDGGKIRFGIEKADMIVGLSRVTDGENYQSFCFNEYESNGGVISDCPAGLDYFDYCVYCDAALQYHIYTLECVEDTTGLGVSSYSMVEFDYGSPISAAKNSYVEFTLDNNNVIINLFTLSDTIVTLKLKPICNNTYQLVPKVCIKGVNVVTILQPPDLLAITNKPNYPIINVSGVTDLSDCNIGWIVNNYWDFGGTSTGVPTQFTTRDSYLTKNYSRFATWETFKADEDASIVQTLGQSVTIPLMSNKNFFWSYTFDNTLNTAAGGFKYTYIPVDTDVNTKYIFKPKGTVIIPYNTKHLFFHCNANLDGAIGFNPRFKKGVEVTDDTDQIVQLGGTNRIAMSSNDILYIRIDLGNAYTMNGNTSSISKIISPILTDIENSGIDSALGIRTYQPERMYLDLNNGEDLYINSINVSIVTRGERFARELAPSTSASFHIMSP